MNVERLLPHDLAMRFCVESLNDSLALQFSHAVAEVMDWNKATYKTFTKSEVTDSALLDFAHGGKISRTPDPDEWLMSSLHRRSKQQSSFVFVEDWQLRPGAAIISTHRLPALYNGQETYFAIDIDNPRLDDNLFGICCANLVPLFHGFLIRGAAPHSATPLNADMLTSLAKEVILIYIGVYDGESYLVCSFS